MEFFNASLLLRSEKNAPQSEEQRYKVLPYDDEIVRLEADETAMQFAANEFEQNIDNLERVSASLENKLQAAPNQKMRYKIRQRLNEVNLQLEHNTERLQDTSIRIEEIRQLLRAKHLTDVENVEQPEHVSRFDTDSKEKSKNIQMDEVVPDGLVYKIQLGYYPSDVDTEKFRGLFPISGETVREDLARYYAGIFFSYSDANEGSEYVRENAIANAFIVPFYNGDKISISRAVVIERQRGVK
jgi:hypothetical protein